MRSSVLCFGEALVDLLAEPVTSPASPQRFVRYAGGAPANVAVALARLGTPSLFVGMLAHDAFGDFLLQSLQAAGVGTHYTLRTHAAHTALALVSLDASGERQFSFYRPPAADLLFRTGDFQDACFADAAAFHCCSNSLTEAGIAGATFAGMQRAAAAGALLSFDMNLRPELWPEGADPHPSIWRALDAVHVVKLTAAELAFLSLPLGGEAAAFARLWQGHAQCVVVTDAAAPIRYFTRTGHGSIPAFAVQAVNATAAGDAFVAGMLSRLVQENLTAETLREWLADPEHLHGMLRFAAACGALAVMRHGAFEAMPALVEVGHFLEAHP